MIVLVTRSHQSRLNERHTATNHVTMNVTQPPITSQGTTHSHQSRLNERHTATNHVSRNNTQPPITSQQMLYSPGILY